MSQKKEGKEKVPNPVLSLEEIEKAKGLSAGPSSKRRHSSTPRRNLTSLWRVVDLQDA